MRSSRRFDKLRAAILLRASSEALLDRLDDDDPADAQLKRRVRRLHGDVREYTTTLASRLRLRVGRQRSDVHDAGR